MKLLVSALFASCLFSSTSWSAEEPAIPGNGFYQQSDLVVVEPPARHVNLRVNPLTLGMGHWNVDVDIGVTNWLTVGPTFAFHRGYRKTSVSIGGALSSSENSNFGAYAMGVRANVYVSGQRFRDGWVLAPFAAIAPGFVTVNQNGKEFEGKFTGAIFGMLFTRQFVWDSGINVNVGAGFAYMGLPDNVTASAKNGDGTTVVGSVLENQPFRNGKLLPSFDLTLGFAL